ncbi:MAG: TonB-dependent receptor [Candidatus Symbiothrix sp.]|jgi:TonB-linked SusC/RagA family outer membrane protein|nr:TonB-dependent receptor [Candidatus Symbiothrix sp.]
MKNTIYIVIICLFMVNLSNAQIKLDSDSLPVSSAIAYGTQPDWMITGAVASVKGDELTSSFTSNVANTLFGRIPGLTVQQTSGEPGLDMPVLNIRGLNTFGAGTGLFIVIDGLPSNEECFRQLTPQEIESVTALKDASTTAIYGNRAANGVLLITTQKGKERPTQINFGAKIGFQQPLNLPDFLGSYDYARLYNEGMLNDDPAAIPRYSAADLNAYQSGADPYLYPDVNWYDQVFRKSVPVSTYNLNVSGGNKTARYFVLFNYLTDSELYKKTEDLSEYTKNAGYSRYNFRTNVDLDLTSKLSALITLGGTVEDKTNPGVKNKSLSLQENSTNFFQLLGAIPPNAFPVYTANGRPGGSSLYTNPLADISQTGYYSYNGRTAQISAKLNLDLDFITPGLSISGLVGFNTSFKSYSIKAWEYERFSVSKDAAGDYIYTTIGQNVLIDPDERKSTQWRNMIYQGFLNYKRTFGIHDVTALLMADYDENAESGISLNTKNAGLGGQATYVFDKRYIAGFSFGYNGADNFPKGGRFGFFPAFSAGWIVSNENFLKDNEVLNFLKLKASYGLTGNMNIGGERYMYDQYYLWGGYYALGTSNANVDTYKEGALVNTHVTWEKQKSLNVGLETVLFKNLSFGVDVFDQKRTNILAQPFNIVPKFMGITYPYLNIGKTSNKGFEARLRYDSEEKNQFSWFAEATAGLAKNKITYNAEAPRAFSYLYHTGHIINQPFGLEAIGFFKDEADIVNSPRQTFATVQPGDIKYKNQNDDNVIDANDFVPIGYSPLPEATFGFYAGAQYRGFDLNLFFQGTLHRTVYLKGNYYEAFQNNGKVSSIALGRWTEETAATATYPRLSAKDNLNNFQPSDFWQRDGSFLKLRSLELGYSLPNQLTEKVHLEKVRVFFSGANLLSFDHLDGLSDPETLSGYPAMRTFSLGINVQL